MNTEVKSDNEVIAEFYCKPELETFSNKHYEFNGLLYPVDELQFHISWDWLMPAFGKFSSLHFKYEELRGQHSDHCASIAEKILEVDITLACERLAEGIHWYNSLSK